MVPSRFFRKLINRPRPRPLLALCLSLQLVHLLQLGHVQVPPLAPLMLHYVLQPRRRRHEGRVAVREGPDDPRPPPDLAVDALDPAVRPDLAPVLRREFRVGQRLGEPVAHRPRGRRAEPRHDELEFPGARDEPSRVVAAAVGLPARRPLVALGHDELGRLLVKQRVERSIVDRCDVRRRGSCPFRQ